MTAIGAAGAGTWLGETAYASNINYRAFGAVKSMSMSTTAPTAISMAYDNALRLTSYEADNSNPNYVQKANYIYHNDGMLKEISNVADPKFDQKNEYDFAGRLRKNDVGQTGGVHPLIQTMNYDAFDNLTTRSNNIYQTYGDSFTASYANNRKSSGGNSYDEYDKGGNVVASYGYSNLSGGGYVDNKYWKFDAAGQMVRWEEYGPWGNQTKYEETAFDGDGRGVKHRDMENLTWYYVISSVTGQKITELYEGMQNKTFIYMGSSQIAEAVGTESPTFKVTDPVSGSTRKMASTGVTYNVEGWRVELAALGMTIPLEAPPNYPLPDYESGGFVGNSETGCTWNGAPINCNEINSIIRRGGSHTIYVNERSEGGWGLYHSLNSRLVQRTAVWDDDGGELEPLGARANPDPNEIILPEYGKGGSVFNPESGCQIDYGPVSCSFSPSRPEKNVDFCRGQVHHLAIA